MQRLKQLNFFVLLEDISPPIWKASAILKNTQCGSPVSHIMTQVMLITISKVKTQVTYWRLPHLFLQQEAFWKRGERSYRTTGLLAHLVIALTETADWHFAYAKLTACIAVFCFTDNVRPKTPPVSISNLQKVRLSRSVQHHSEISGKVIWWCPILILPLSFPATSGRRGGDVCKSWSVGVCEWCFRLDGHQPGRP